MTACVTIWVRLCARTADNIHESRTNKALSTEWYDSRQARLDIEPRKHFGWGPLWGTAGVVDQLELSSYPWRREHRGNRSHHCGLDDPRVSHCLELVLWWHVSRCLAHVNAGTRCVYGQALGKSIAFVRGGSYAVVKPMLGEGKEYIWYRKVAVSFAFEVLINVVAVVVFCTMGLKSGLQIEWLAIMVGLVAHLSSWVRLAITRAEALKLRSWKDAKG